jgi:hypothetical protein
MKKHLYLIVTLLCITSSFSQKKEKIKGSKVVTVTIKDLETFTNIEIEDNLEVFFVKAEKPSIEIEADDNLHDVVSYDLLGKTLKVSSKKYVSSAKKFAVRINYNDSLQSIVARHESTINALADLTLNKCVVKTYDESRAFLNVMVKDFTLSQTDKSESEVNIKADKVAIELTKEAEFKGLVAAPESKIDLYQKAEAEIEGDTQVSKIRLDNNSNLTAKKFTIKDLELIAESYTKCSINVKNTVEISASGKTEIDLLGDCKVDLKIFKNAAILSKKEK